MTIINNEITSRVQFYVMKIFPNTITCDISLTIFVILHKLINIVRGNIFVIYHRTRTQNTHTCTRIDSKKRERECVIKMD